MKKIIIIFIVLVLMISLNQNQISINGNTINIELATTPLERTKGLMFRENLQGGMLFIFEEEDTHSFWMKNTLIPLDIIWLNKNKEVVFIKKNAQPCKEKYCQSITPTKKAKYVLELNAFESDKLDIKVGNKIDLDNI